MPGREFFTALTVDEALRLLPGVALGRTERVPLGAALGRVPAADLAATAPLPGFARSTVDGYAVRAADTYGSSEGLPAYLRLAGAVRMGRPAEVSVPVGGAVAVPTGGVLPDGADAVVMVEHTQETVLGAVRTVEVVRPAAPGDGVVGAAEDVALGSLLVPAGRSLRPQDLGLLAAAGLVEVEVRARPRVALLATGDEVVPPGTATLRAGQVRDATTSALVGLVAQAGGDPMPRGIVPDDAARLEEAVRVALTAADLVVVSAGSSVGGRDETAGVVARLGRVLCHGLALKPGKPTLLAECGGVPVIGLPGNPLSALVVFRLLGVPLVRRLGGCVEPPAEPVVRARLSRPLASAAGRRDVVQVRLAGGAAEPVLGSSALLSVLTAADGFLVVPEPATGLDAGTEVDVTVYR